MNEEQLAELLRAARTAPRPESRERARAAMAKAQIARQYPQSDTASSCVAPARRLYRGFRRWLPAIAAALIFAAALAGMIASKNRHAIESSKVQSVIAESIAPEIAGPEEMFQGKDEESQIYSRLMRKSYELYKRQDDEAITKFWQAARNEYPKFPGIQINALYNLGLRKKTPAEMKETAKVMADLAKNHQHDPKYAEAAPASLRLLARASGMEHNSKQELQYLQELMERFPKTKVAAYAVSDLAGAGNFSDAPQAMQVLMKKYPGTPIADAALRELGIHYIWTNDKKEAGKIYEMMKTRNSEYAANLKWFMDNRFSHMLHFYVAADIRSMPPGQIPPKGYKFWQFGPNQQYFQTQERADFQIFDVKAKFKEFPQWRDGRQIEETSKAILIEMTKEDGTAFAKLTGDNLNKYILIVFGGEVIAAPVVKGRIADGNFMIPADNLSEGQIKALLGLPEKAPSPKPTGPGGLPPEFNEPLAIKRTNPARAKTLLEQIGRTPTGVKYKSLVEAHIIECVGLEGKFAEARKLAFEYTQNFPNDQETYRALRVFLTFPSGTELWRKAPEDLHNISKAHPGTKAEVAALSTLVIYYKLAGQLDLAKKIIDEVAKLPGQAESVKELQRIMTLANPKPAPARSAH